MIVWQNISNKSFDFIFIIDQTLDTHINLNFLDGSPNKTKLHVQILFILHFQVLTNHDW